MLAAPAAPSGAALPQGLISPTMARKTQTQTQTPIPRSAPLPPAFPRRRLELPLAVLLLRSCYDALDSSDLVPMDRFQVDFFRIRSDCWEPYLELRARAAAAKAGGGGSLGGSSKQQQQPRPQQGDLSDPAYFDVIAFSQAATIDAEFKKVEEAAFVARAEAAGGGMGVGSGGVSSSPSSSSSSRSYGVFEFVPSFEEYCEAGVEEGCPESGRRRVVRSSPLLLPAVEGGEGGGGEGGGEGREGESEAGETDLAASLWASQRAAAGDLIYSRLAAGSFRGLEFKGVPRPPATLGEVKGAAEALAGVFVDNGFALKQTVSVVVSSGSPDSGAAAAAGESEDAARRRTAVVSLRLDGPADLWATGALGGGAAAASSSRSFLGFSSSSSSSSAAAAAAAAQGSAPPPPAFAGIALGGLLRASGALVVGKEPLSVGVVGGGTATEVSWRVSER